MTDFDSTARNYIAAWNAPEGDREAAVQAAFAEGATYTDPLADVAGHDAIVALIGAVRAQFPDHTFRLVQPVDGHHRQARLTWALEPGEPVVGFDVVSLDEAGLITTVLGFLDKVPA